MMDFRGASWVGDIYQKFEAMCLEVEDTICEDAVKFVENQVQNVGSNMKKFYADVMQDLASPDSNAPVKQPVNNLPQDSYSDTEVNEKKKTSNKEDSEKVVNSFTDDLKVIEREDGDQLSSLNEYDKQRVNSRSRGTIKGSFSIKYTKGEQYEDTTVCCKKVSNKDRCRKTTSKNQVLENQDGAPLVSEIIYEHATTEKMVLSSPQASVEVEGWEWDSREEEKELRSCEGIDIDDFTVNGPISTDLTSRLIGEGLAQDSTGKEDVIETDDTTDQKVETSNEDQIELEETCVFVNDNNISFASYKDGKPWSYKKKMREAFSLKRKSSRRQEYKKLVTQYEYANTSSSLTCIDTVTHTVSPEPNTAELQTQEFCESDWEIL